MKKNDKVFSVNRWLLSSKAAGKKVMAFGLTTFMVVSMLPTSALASKGVDSLALINSLDLESAQSINLENTKPSVASQLQNGTIQQESETVSIDKDEDVTIIVDIEGDSLVDKFEESGETDVNEFIDENQDVKEEIKDDVQEVADEVIEEIKGNAEVVYTYDTLFTGAAISAKYGDLDKIRKMDGVERAYIAKTYSVPEDQECDLGDVTPSMVTSREIINTGLIQNNANLDFRGQGMVVAIVDTGISYMHEAFAKNPEGAAFTQAIMVEKLANLDLVSEDKFEGVLNAEGIDDASVFKSLKVPYGYDYNDNDTEITPLNSENHGTHVSGTVAGNSDTVQGVAPEAQLMGMKVFDNEGSTSDAVLLAALQDSVLLGADVINMSLGATCGFMVDENPMLAEVYATIEEQGINLDVSAGNSANSADYNVFDGMALTTNPDTGTIGSPATFHSALAIAAYENTYLNYCNYFILADGTKIGYADLATDADDKFTTLSGDYDYVYCGTGSPEEVAAAGDLTGKIALVVRGALSFTDKVVNVQAGHAVAMILYNNTDGTINMSIDNYLVPAVSITKELGEKMVAAIDPETKVGTISFDPTVTTSFENPLAGKMCSFSSWGPAPDLSIKPEITAPGGNIYSSYWVDENGDSVYGMMSGTSMSCPHMSGATAVVKQYVQEKYPDMEPKDVEYLVNCLLMSTAKPIVEGTVSDEENTNYYSPRIEGAGLADVYAAVTSKAYLSVDGCERPKAELGSNKNGRFTFYTTINNMSDEELTYDLSGAVQIEDYMTTEDGVNLSTKTSTNGLGDWAKISFNGSRVKRNTVTVAANSNVEVRVTVAIDKTNEDLQQYMIDHPDGFYVEGFAFAQNEEESLSLPFLGFCGNWATPSSFDATMYEVGAGTGTAQSVESICYNDVSGVSVLLGGNLLKAINGEDDISYSADQISVSPNSLWGITSRLATQTYTLRNSKELDAIFKNEKGKVLETTVFDNIPKSFYYTNYGLFVWAEAFYDNYPVFTGFDEEGNEYQDGQYSLTWSSLPVGVKDNKKNRNDLTYDFTLDAEAPAFDMDNTMLFELDGTIYLYVKATDNDYLAGWQLLVKRLDGTSAAIDTKYFEHEMDVNGSTTETQLYTLGTTEDFVAAGFDSNSVELDLFDWAMNMSVQDVDLERVPSAAATTINTVDNTGYNEITVNWNLSEGATGYKVLRSTTEDGKYSVIANVKDGATTSYVDTGNFNLNQMYFYKVKPYAKGTYMGESMTKYAKASPAMGTTVVIPSATKLKRAENTFLGCTMLQWERVANVTGYEVVRSLSPNGEYAVVRTVRGSRYVGCIDLTPTIKGQSYFYKVRPFFEKDGQTYYGEFSNIKKVIARRSFGSIWRFFQ